MAVVHGLQGDATVIAVEIAVLHQVLDRVDDLRNEKELDRAVIQRIRPRKKKMAHTFFRMLACSSRASNMAACVSLGCYYCSPKVATGHGEILTESVWWVIWESGFEKGVLELLQREDSGNTGSAADCRWAGFR